MLGTAQLHKLDFGGEKKTGTTPQESTSKQEHSLLKCPSTKARSQPLPTPLPSSSTSGPGCTTKGSGRMTQHATSGASTTHALTSAVFRRHSLHVLKQISTLLSCTDLDKTSLRQYRTAEFLLLLLLFKKQRGREEGREKRTEARKRGDEEWGEGGKRALPSPLTTPRKPTAARPSARLKTPSAC